MPSASPILAQVAPCARALRTHWVRFSSSWAPAAATCGSTRSTSARLLSRSQGASRGPAGRFSAMISWHSATQLSQMKTPGPATTAAASVFGLPQNEQDAIAERLPAFGITPPPCQAIPDKL